MIRLSLAAAASALVLVACASAPATETTTEVAASTATVSPFEMAMQTVQDLVDAGNTPAAIDRLTQLTGDPTLSRNQLAEVLSRRGELRLGEHGYDTMGAVEDFQEVTEDFADHLERHALRDQERGGAVAQLVRTPVAEARARLDHLVPLVLVLGACVLRRRGQVRPHVGRVECRTGDGAEDQIDTERTIGPLPGKRGALARLPAPTTCCA